MGHPNDEVIQRFYTAFSKGDTATIDTCYHEQAEFSDPAFGHLNAAQVRAMWKMLVERSKGNLTITFGNIKADDKQGQADWEAVYNFSKTGRRVHNKVHASFEFRDGKIYRHNDKFSFWRWSAMALGPIGYLLGFTPIVQGKVMKQSRALLDEYMKHAS